MPLCLSSVIVRVSLDMAGVILIAAGLGFLGLGAQPPSPEWGAMIAAGRKYMLDQWWVAAMPGIAIAVVSLGFNLLGDGLRDVLDPQAAMTAPLLELRDLGRSLRRQGGGARRQLQRWGASGSASSANPGSGKSLTGRAILRLLPPQATMQARRVSPSTASTSSPPARTRCGRCAAGAWRWCCRTRNSRSTR